MRQSWSTVLTCLLLYQIKADACTEDEPNKVFLRRLRPEKWPLEGEEDEFIINAYADLCTQLSKDVGPGGSLGVRLKEFANLVRLENSLQYLYDRDKGEWAKPLRLAVETIRQRHGMVKGFAQTLNNQRDSADLQKTIVQRAEDRDQRAAQAEKTFEAMWSDTKEVLAKRQVI